MGNAVAKAYFLVGSSLKSTIAFDSWRFENADFILLNFDPRVLKKGMNTYVGSNLKAVLENSHTSNC
jgi:hypothetical protein